MKGGREKSESPSNLMCQPPQPTNFRVYRGHSNSTCLYAIDEGWKVGEGWYLKILSPATTTSHPSFSQKVFTSSVVNTIHYRDNFLLLLKEVEKGQICSYFYSFLFIYCYTLFYYYDAAKVLIIATRIRKTFVIIKCILKLNNYFFNN